MNKLLPFMFSQNLSVDNALSTQQIIHQLITKMNEVTEYVSNWESDYEGYVDDKISTLALDIDKKLRAIDIELTKYVDDSIANERQYVNTWNTNLQVQIDEVNRLIYRLLDETKVELKNLITDTSNVDREYTDKRINEVKLIIAELNQKLDELASKSFASYSPRDGMLKSNDECFKDLQQLIYQGSSGYTWDFWNKFAYQLNFLQPSTTGDFTKATFNWSTISYGMNQSTTDGYSRYIPKNIEYLQFNPFVLIANFKTILQDNSKWVTYQELPTYVFDRIKFYYNSTVHRFDFFNN